MLNIFFLRIEKRVFVFNERQPDAQQFLSSKKYAYDPLRLGRTIANIAINTTKYTLISAVKFVTASTIC